MQWSQDPNLRNVHNIKNTRREARSHPALNVNSASRGTFSGTAMWISTQEANYWSYILHSSNTWEEMGIHWSSVSAVCL